MKKIFFALVAMVVIGLGASVGAVAAGKDPGKVDVSFDSMEFDFGTISADSKPVGHEFVMTNNSSLPVAILSASTSCGCTRPEFNKKPVAPGKTARIKVSFIPQGQKGEIHRDIKLRLKSASGKNKRVTLKISGVVIPADKK